MVTRFIKGRLKFFLHLPSSFFFLLAFSPLFSSMGGACNYRQRADAGERGEERTSSSSTTYIRFPFTKERVTADRLVPLFARGRAMTRTREEAFAKAQERKRRGERERGTGGGGIRNGRRAFKYLGAIEPFICAMRRTNTSEVHVWVPLCRFTSHDVHWASTKP